MADWQQFVQSIFFGVIFSYLLAKLFSIIFAFRDENLRIARADHVEGSVSVSESESESKSRSLIDDSRVLEAEEEEEREALIKDVAAVKESSAAVEEEEDVGGGDEVSDSDSDSDWEGVETTELDEEFSAATAFVAATAADRGALKVSNEVQLQLYGLYKIASEGPCTAPQPSALKMTARAKWQAWQKLGAMPPEEAMEKYIDIVTELFPSWTAGSGTKKKGEESEQASSKDSKGPMGPVFSTLNFDEEPGNQLQMDAIHAFAREGDKENMLKCIDSGVSVDLKDSEGRTPLHWAVDRGHLDIVELLVSKKSDVNAKDNEGQTPLHYATVCERAAIAEFLVKEGVDIEIKDDDGNTPGDLCELNWPWMQHSAAHD